MRRETTPSNYDCNILKRIEKVRSKKMCGFAYFECAKATQSFKSITWGVFMF